MNFFKWLSKSFPSSKTFQTNQETKNTIYTFSDIHGDIDALIIILRDCAKVIRKVDGKELDINKRDPELDYLLNIPLDANNNNNIEPVNAYNPSLNYEWCANDTTVIICGDIIDPTRPYYLCKKKDDTDCLYYPQIELKILLFINELDRQARENKNSKIIKILGNHEIENMCTENRLYPDYVLFNDRQENNPSYYVNKLGNIESREKIFNFGNYGYELLLKGECGLLVMINNVVYVHGGLVKTIGQSNYIEINELNQKLQNINSQPLLNNFINDILKHEGNILESRKYSDINIISPIIQEMVNNKNSQDYNKFCNNLDEDFKIFLAGSGLEKYNQNLILVVGHCVQSNTKIDHNYSMTYTEKNIKNENNVSDEYFGKVYAGINNPLDRSKMFGMTLSCKGDNYKLYRIDNGTSRSFDEPIEYITLEPYIEMENLTFYSRTPSVLCIKYEGIKQKISMIKSKIKNTRIHQPRELYEEYVNINSINSLNINDPNNVNYMNKYLKYKMKYLNKR
jgi:hypothetical protein